MVCYVRACVRTYVRACARKCQASLQFEVTLGQARLWERPLHNPWDKPAARTGPLLGLAIGNASRQVRFFWGGACLSRFFGQARSLGHALQHARDRPASGTCLAKSLGQTRYWDTYVGTYVRTYVRMPFRILGTSPLLGPTLQHP